MNDDGDHPPPRSPQEKLDLVWLARYMHILNRSRGKGPTPRVHALRARLYRLRSRHSWPYDPEGNRRLVNEGVAIRQAQWKRGKKGL